MSFSLVHTSEGGFSVSVFNDKSGTTRALSSSRLDRQERREYRRAASDLAQQDRDRDQDQDDEASTNLKGIDDSLRSRFGDGRGMAGKDISVKK